MPPRIHNNIFSLLAYSFILINKSKVIPQVAWCVLKGHEMLRQNSNFLAPPHFCHVLKSSSSSRSLWLTNSWSLSLSPSPSSLLLLTPLITHQPHTMVPIGKPPREPCKVPFILISITIIGKPFEPLPPCNTFASTPLLSSRFRIRNNTEDHYPTRHGNG